MSWLAHSPKGSVPVQPYATHIARVVDGAVTFAHRAGCYHSGSTDDLLEMVYSAAAYHDLGKLDDANQEVLRRVSQDPLPVRHEDGGVTELLQQGRKDAAVLVAAHHQGLFSYTEELGKERDRRGDWLRFTEVAAQVNQCLSEYVHRHAADGCPTTLPAARGIPPAGFLRRLALSCLVDADHSDTARHYGKEVPSSGLEPRWTERLNALDAYVQGLAKGGARDQLRQRVYDACRAADPLPSLRACDASVGSGKTTAVMAHLLRTAQQKGLRHIFVVLPYTNIIQQSVETYRAALTLPGERPEEVVAEHHHLADFQDVELRHLTSLWRAPVVVTTAVQFFETLAGYHPARLRKFHELPGSGVFIDETHAAIPAHLWPQMWRWLETLAAEWGGHVVFASGSLPRFWESKTFIDPPKQPNEVPDLLPAELRAELEANERPRVEVRQIPEALTCDGLIQRVTAGAEYGPQLVIVNTVQSAAVIALRMKEQGHDVRHLSTALAPVHRAPIIKQIKERLDDASDRNWTLVATSCVEAGMNFSFRSGFRERAGAANVIQVSGRISRNDEFRGDAVLWDFCLADSELTHNPSLDVPRRVLRWLFENGDVGALSASALADLAMRREYTEGGKERALRIMDLEQGCEHPEVSRLCRVIDTDTLTVVIDPDLIESLRSGRKVDPRDLQRNSVQIWRSKIEPRRTGYRRKELSLAEVLAPLVQPLLSSSAATSSTLYAWTADYDPDFLGYMAGVLPMLQRLREGVFIA